MLCVLLYGSCKLTEPYEKQSKSSFTLVLSQCVTRHLRATVSDILKWESEKRNSKYLCHTFDHCPPTYRARQLPENFDANNIFGSSDINECSASMHATVLLQEPGQLACASVCGNDHRKPLCGPVKPPDVVSPVQYVAQPKTWRETRTN